MKVGLIILILILALWSIYGYFASRVEQSQYTVIEKRNGYEIRLYPKRLVAQTTVSGDYSKSLTKGFGIVAGYIFGGNKTKQPIAMTAPVTVDKSDSLYQDVHSQTIAMTAPVLSSGTNQNRTVSFVMPKEYSLDNLPVPTDKRVRIVEVPEQTFAVLRYSGWRSNSRTESKGKQLFGLLKKDEVTVKLNNYTYAGYNAPFTPPWMTRQEVMFEINSNK